MAERKPPPHQVRPTNSNTRVGTGFLPRRATVPNRRSTLPEAFNSNTRVSPGLRGSGDGPTLAPERSSVDPDASFRGLRQRMVQWLRQAGIDDEVVLAAMLAVPRHVFVDEALASRAYENAALPIGAGQTISQPWIVARMLSALRQSGPMRRVLEIGSGCGYQAALLAALADEVVSIERVRTLSEQAQERLRTLGIRRVRLVVGDGRTGWPAQAPYDAIVVAAAGAEIPDAWLQQLAIGGRLLAPEGGQEQKLVLIQRLTRDRFRRTELEAVRFVPLQTGVQL